MWLRTYYDFLSPGEPAVKVPVDTSRDKMTTKPILFWPKPRSDIALHLDREADDFLVVDTDYPHELQKLYKLRRELPTRFYFFSHLYARARRARRGGGALADGRTMVAGAGDGAASYGVIANRSPNSAH